MDVTQWRAWYIKVIRYNTIRQYATLHYKYTQRTFETL